MKRILVFYPKRRLTIRKPIVSLKLTEPTTPLDATVDPETGMSYYLVEATIDNETLYGHKGDEGAIKIGMTTEAHIVTDSKKILYFLLEKMHLKDW